MRNIFAILVAFFSFSFCFGARSFEAIKPHAYRNGKVMKALPKNAEARELLFFIREKSKGAIALNEDERKLLSIADAYVVLLGMTLEEILTTTRGNEYTIFLLPDGRGFGALLANEEGVQLIQFDAELNIIGAWEKREKGAYVPLETKRAKNIARECLRPWKSLS